MPNVSRPVSYVHSKSLLPFLFFPFSLAGGAISRLFSVCMAKILLCDGHNLAFRAFYGITELSRSDGFPTNMIHGWLRTFWRLEDYEKPDVVRVYFDKGAPARRVNLLPEYKANRGASPEPFKQQLPWVKQLTVALGYTSEEREGLEADDLIAAAAVTLAEQNQEVQVLLHDHNQGKGAALRTGFLAASGDIILIQDADLEYDPRDYGKLLEPLLDGRADVVFGSRFLGGPHRVLNYHHYLANRFLTMLSNILTGLNLTDMETCYKAFRREIIQDMPLRQDRFGFEPEFTARIAARRCRVYEVPISYSGRDYAEGKKITWKDGVAALWTIVRSRFDG